MAINVSSNIAPIALGLSRWAGKGDLQSRLFSESMAEANLELQKTQIRDQIANQAIQRTMQRKQFAANQNLQNRSMALQEAAATRADRALADQVRRTELSIEGLESQRGEQARISKNRMQQLQEWDMMKKDMDPEDWTRGRISILQGKQPPKVEDPQGLSAYQEAMIGIRRQESARKFQEQQKEDLEEAVAGFRGADMNNLNRMLDGMPESEGKEWITGVNENADQAIKFIAEVMGAYPAQSIAQAQELRAAAQMKAREKGYSDRVIQMIPSPPIKRYTVNMGGDSGKVPESQVFTAGMMKELLHK